jgi:hypothetical protein
MTVAAGRADELDQFPAIEEALAGGVLMEAGGRLAFRHDVFGQALDASIPESLRRTLHAKAASALRRNGASATARRTSP